MARCCRSAAARRGNNYLIDGGPITDMRNRASANPSIEAIEDVAVQVHHYDAETAATGGGVFNVATRSGTNQWHGSGFYQNRPRAGAANYYFSRLAGIAKPDTYFHLGGAPLVVPYSPTAHSSGSQSRDTDRIPSRTEQVGLMQDLNQAVQEEFDDVHYAPMVAVGWHGRSGLLVLTNAGHPSPFWYRAARDEWSWLETQRPSERGRSVGVPLGLPADINYDRIVVKPQPGDLMVLYTDGVSEATNSTEEELGRDGLINLARELDSSSAEAFGTQLTSALRRFRGGVEPVDDETIIVMQRVAT